MANDSTRRLHHQVPPWIAGGAIYHIRIRTSADWPASLLEPSLAAALLKSAALYHEQNKWNCPLFLLMPDHLHALLSFPPDATMAKTMGKGKAWHQRHKRVAWQENFFDHRIRNDHELLLKADYIRRNPVAKGLCRAPQDWPWLLDADSLNCLVP